MTTGESPADQAAVAAVPQQLLEAWARHDAAPIADLFTEDGTLILPGVFRQGRQDIKDYFSEAFDGDYAGTQVVGTPIGLRFLGPDTALLLSSGGVLAAGETEVSGAQAIRASWLVVRAEGRWRLAAYQNTPAGQTLPKPGTTTPAP
ncbi:SgcJ/EcaC family oxidoreductase [Amycolatopsis sp. NBC_01480]|uniref:SgcJ/EcaC family oxidoreductase n=1 Tax=Amycolatopsis sp. NBC_01480 TaxID=2903562 RepID=UPI002E2886B7|nr:SgcJ/EcaC family oxidoreductase [Amycolatopsis sp. NBC_01480]